MDRGAWQDTAHEVVKSRHSWASNFRPLIVSVLILGETFSQLFFLNCLLWNKNKNRNQKQKCLSIQPLWNNPQNPGDGAERVWDRGNTHFWLAVWMHRTIDKWRLEVNFPAPLPMTNTTVGRESFAPWAGRVKVCRDWPIRPWSGPGMLWWGRQVTK